MASQDEAGASGVTPAVLVLLGVLVLATLVVTVAAIPGVRPEPGFSPLVDGWIKGTAYVLTAVIAALRPIFSSRDRLAWSLIAAALAARAVGFVLYLGVIRTMEPVPYPSLADAAWFVMCLLLLSGLIAFARTRLPQLASVLVLDALAAVLTVIAIASALLGGAFTAIAAPGTLDPALVTALTYPVFDIALLVVVTGMLVSLRLHVPRPLWWLAAGIVGLAVSDSVYVYQVAVGGFQPGTTLSVITLATTGVIAVAPWRGERHPITPDTERLPDLVIPTAIGLGCLGVLLLASFRELNTPAVVVAALGLVVLFVRTALTVRIVRSFQMLERVQQLAGVGHWERYPDTGQQAWSPRTFEILGLDPAVAEANAATLAATVHPDDASMMARVMEQATTTGIVDVVYRVLRPDGAVRVAHVRSRPDVAPDGRILRWLGTVQDITEIERLAAALARSEDSLRRVLAATNDGWWTEDLRTGEAFHSDRWWELHGYQPGAFPDDSQLWRRLTYPDDVERMEMAFADAARDGVTSFTTRTRVLHRDGHVVPILMRALVDYDDQGGAYRYSAATTDLTEAQQAERTKDAFISTVSHELRTPLTAIGGSLETLQAGVVGELPEAARGLVSLAQRNTFRLRALVDDLLDLERLLAGQARFDVAPRELLPVLEQTIEDNRDIAVRQGVRFELARQGEGLRARFDPSRVAQVLANFLSNAARFAPSGSLVEVRVGRHGSMVRTEVVDRGPGVPPSFAPRAFERFAQADSTDRRSQGGTGLGLAINKEIVERLGGTVGFESEPGRTSFYFELPASDVSAQGMSDAPDTPDAAPDATVAPGGDA